MGGWARPEPAALSQTLQVRESWLIWPEKATVAQTLGTWRPAA